MSYSHMQQPAGRSDALSLFFFHSFSLPPPLPYTRWDHDINSSRNSNTHSRSRRGRASDGSTQPVCLRAPNIGNGTQTEAAVNSAYDVRVRECERDMTGPRSTRESSLCSSVVSGQVRSVRSTRLCAVSLAHPQLQPTDEASPPASDNLTMCSSRR